MLIKKVTTAKIRNRTYTLSIGGSFRLGAPVVYNRNTRRCTIKVYAGIATLAFAREPSAKAKKSAKTM